jgi:hypothetical protein
VSAATAAITVGGSPAASKLVQFKIERLGTNGSDNLAVAARLMGAMIGYGRT